MDWGKKFCVLAVGVEPPAGMRMCRKGLHWYVPTTEGRRGCAACRRSSQRTNGAIIRERSEFCVLAAGVEPPPGIRTCKRGLHWFPEGGVCSQCKRDYSAAWDAKRKGCPEYRATRRAYTLRYKTGFTPELLEARKQEQDGKCAICEVELDFAVGPQHSTKAQADHCHDTGTPRGFLCIRCNVSLGAYESAILPHLDKVKAYLAKYSK